MSDPMTNSEVEDVLSSIRRLVSDETRSGVTAPEDSKQLSDRLVLTPSLRVSEGDEPQVEEDVEKGNVQFVSSGSKPADAVDTKLPKIDNSSLVHVQDRAVQDDRPVILKEAKENASENSSDLDLEAQRTWEATDDLYAEAWRFQSERHVDVEEAPEEQTDVPETLGDKIAALETLIADRADEWEPDAVGSGANAGTEPPAMDWENTDKADADVIEGPQEGDPVLMNAEPDVEAAQPVREAETGDVLEPESDLSDTTVVGDEQESEEMPEADLDTDIESQGVEQIEDAPTTEADPAQQSHGDQEPVEDVIMDDVVLDEAMLRELVSDIVREELQGALGERITRNVRKLVRRELHRALAAQDLE